MRISSKSRIKSFKNKSFDNHSIISSDYLFFKNVSFKKKRNKNSYLEAFLEKRRMAAEFAQKKLSYSTISIKPKIINNEKINELSLKEEELANINNLKKNLPGKALSIIDNKNLNYNKYSNNFVIENNNSIKILNQNIKNNNEKLIQKFADNINNNLNCLNEKLDTNSKPSFEFGNDEKEETSKFGNKILETNKSRKLGIISTKNTENEKETFYIENNMDINNSELTNRDNILENNKEKNIIYNKKIKKINTYIKKRPRINENNSIATLREKNEFIINNQINNSISFRNDLNSNKNQNIDSKDFLIKHNDKNKNDINRYIETNNEENDNNNINIFNNYESIETSNDALEEVNVIKTTESNENEINVENCRNNKIEINNSKINFEKEKNTNNINLKLENNSNKNNQHNNNLNNIEIQTQKNKDMNCNYFETNDINSPVNTFENKFILSNKEKIIINSKQKNIEENKNNFIQKEENKNFKKISNLKITKNEDNTNYLNKINDLIRKIKEKRKNKNSLMNINKSDNKKFVPLENNKIYLRNNNKEIKNKIVFNTKEDKTINNFFNNSSNCCNILNYKNNIINKFKNKNNNLINKSKRIQDLLNNIKNSKIKEDTDNSNCIFTQNVINYINNFPNQNRYEETKKIINNNFNYKINNINYNNQSNNFILLQNYYNNDTKNYRTSINNFGSFNEKENNVTDINFISEENSENEIINKDMKLFDEKLFKNIKMKHKRISKSKPTINLVKINKNIFINGKSEYNKNITNSRGFSKSNLYNTFADSHLYIDKVKEDLQNRNNKIKIEKYTSKSKTNLINSNIYLMNNITNKSSKKNSIDMNIMPANNLKGLFKF